MITESAPTICDGDCPASAAIANAIAIAVIAAASAGPAPTVDRPASPATKPSGRSSAAMPSARRLATSAAMRSVSFTRTFAGAANAHFGAVAGERRDGRQFIDESGTSSGAMSTRPMRSPSTMTVPRVRRQIRPSLRRSRVRQPAAGHRATPCGSGSARHLRVPPANRAAPPRQPSRTRRRENRRDRELLAGGDWGPSIETRLPPSSMRTVPPNALIACSV